MDFLWDKITEWLKEMLIGGIVSNLSGMFDATNQKVAEISGQVGLSPQAWNGSIFGMIQNLSETVIVPIAGAILAFVMTLELIQLITDKNNLNDMDTWIFFKWAFKSAAAVLIVTNTWTIVMGVFDAAQSVVASASGLIIGDTSINISSVMVGIEDRLMEMELGPLFGLWFQSLFVGITMWALTICIFIITFGRMIEIYLVTSVAPIPMATMMGKEWGGMDRITSVPCWRWASKHFSSSSALPSTRFWCRTSRLWMTSSTPSGLAWATRCCCASACSKRAALPSPCSMRINGGDTMLTLTPVTLATANAFVNAHHRHHKATAGHKFSIGYAKDGELVGVAIVGRPVSRYLDDGWTLEVNRLCTTGEKNACSILYAASARAAKAMGYRKIITYTLDSESGSSLRAVGWSCAGLAGGKCWTGSRKPASALYPAQMKLRYEKLL